MESRFVWMDGRLVPFEQATVHFLSPAIHYGLAVFEGVRAYPTPRGPGIFRAREHAERLLHSARIFGLRELGYGAADLALAMSQTVAANGYPACYIRPVIYMASGAWNLNLDTGRHAVGIAVWEWTQFLGEEAFARGVRANVSSFTRHHPNVMMTKAKISGNYANSVLAKTESVRLGFDEAIMLDPYGFVAECTGENLFLVKDGKIRTPDSATVLEGITRLPADRRGPHRSPDPGDPASLPRRGVRSGPALRGLDHGGDARLPARGVGRGERSRTSSGAPLRKLGIDRAKRRLDNRRP